MSEDPKKSDHWFRDWLVYGRSSQVALLMPGLCLLGVISLILILRCAPDGGGIQTANEVVIYAAQDQVYVEPILQEFEQETGIKVRAVYDSEAVKTVGLANRLLAEQKNPQCDVFWGNEDLRARQLLEKKIFQAQDGFAIFGARTRKLVANTNLVDNHDGGRGVVHTGPVTDPSRQRPIAPVLISELTNAVWRGKVAVAYPLFGTTATHFLALRHYWGEEQWLAWCRGLVANEAFIVDGNSAVVKMVGRGEAWLGLTDSDDIVAGMKAGLPVEQSPLVESMTIPNVVAIIRDAPHPGAAEKLYRYLLKRKVAQQLVEVGALEGLEGSSGMALEPDWTALLNTMDKDLETLKKVFLR